VTTVIGLSLILVRRLRVVVFLGIAVLLEDASSTTSQPDISAVVVSSEDESMLLSASGSNDFA